MYSWQSSKQYRPIQVSGTKCWPRNYHPATVTVRCSNISHQDQHRCPNKKRPSWENMQHFVIFVWFVFCFCSRGFSSFHPSFEFQQFWFCVLFSFANIAEQWEPRKKKGFGSHSSICDFETCTLKLKKKAWAPSPYCVTHHLLHQGCHPSTDVLSHRQVTKETLWLLWLSSSSPKSLESSYGFRKAKGTNLGWFLSWGGGTPRKARLGWIDIYRLCIAYI